MKRDRTNCQVRANLRHRHFANDEAKRHHLKKIARIRESVLDLKHEILHRARGPLVFDDRRAI